MNDPAFAAYVRNPSQFFKGILPCISTELNSILERIFCLDPALRISLPELRLRILQCKSFTNRYAFIQSRRSFNIDSSVKQEYQQQRRSSSVGTCGHNNNHRCNVNFQLNNDANNGSVMEYTNSTAMTILHYIQGYIDEERALGINKIIPINKKSTSTTLHTHSNNNNKKKLSGFYLQPPAIPSSPLVTSVINPTGTSPTPSYSSSSCSSASSAASDCPSTPRTFNNTTKPKFLDVNNIQINKKQARHFLHQNASLSYHWSFEQY